MHLQGHRCFTLHPVCSIYLIYTYTLLMKPPSPTATYTEAQHTDFEISSCLLDSFENFLKATVCFTMSVRLSVWNNYSLAGFIFMKIVIIASCENVYRSLQFYENLTRIRVLYMKTNTHLRSYLAQYSEYEKCFRQILQRKSKYTFHAQ